MITSSNKYFTNLENVSIFEKLKFWDIDIAYFVKFSVLYYNVNINKNRLKNIFCSVIEDLRLWREISIMFDYNILSFNYNFLYFNSGCNNLNSLSLILFEIYMSEFDFYVFNLSRYFYYKYFFYKNFFYHCFLNEGESLIFPLAVKKSNFLYNFRSFSSKLTLFYNRSISYLRYIGYFFFGVAGSVFFTRKLCRKFIAFVKGNLLLELHDFFVFSSFDKNIIFGGFQISFFSNSSSTYSTVNKKNFLSNSIFLKLKKFKLNMLKNFSTRFYFEFLFRLRNLDFIRTRQLISLKDNRIWLFFIFFQSVSFFNTENFYHPLNEFISPFKNSFCVYFFNSYLFVVKKNLTSFKNKLFLSSVLPLDLAFNLVLTEFQTNFLMINNDLFDLLDFKVRFARSYFVNKKSFFSGILFSSPNLMSFWYYYLQNSSSISKREVKLHIPLNIIIYRLRLMGIFHFFKNRPIGSSFLMFEEDIKIYQFFRMLLFSFLRWYDFHFTSNYLKLYFIYALLSRSFLLTISRKHNKSLAWSYSLYRYVFVLTDFKYDMFMAKNNFKIFNERFFLSF